ncbi:hypothetical protein [Flavobacterium sp. LC2016-01]|uniref:hypothetical protein n=1 Tax=Flavobacterium sp. LC2016-01 TaxID=2675876 RepID=UPI0012BADBCB|nr:hypothetical protein [Flavobacterium sp. LC2016-01]MTH17755.1 hypothetical protein [Flavobacterium sp. LC2016-01]
MIKKILLLILVLTFVSCEKVDDDTRKDCSSNCTTIRGRFVSVNDEPVANMNVSLNYRISGGELGGGYTRKIVNLKSDKNGNFDQNFYIKDSELGRKEDGYFDIDITDSKIDVTKYIRQDNLIGTTTTVVSYQIYSITNRDTIINIDYYVPKKAFIKVNLNNFIPKDKEDFFEVQTLYPFGPNIGTNTFLDSKYSTGFSGYDTFKAKQLNTVLNVFVAEGEKNVIRVLKRKNGKSSSEDFPITIPPNNTIELTYEY